MFLRAAPAPALRPTAPRVGLVLGAGGVTGIAWLTGALRALHEQTGWDPASADIVTGTSAGAVAAALLASGVDPAGLLRFAEDDAALAGAIQRATAGRPKGSPGPAWPGSLALGIAGLVATQPRHRLASLAGFLPSGRRPTDEIRALVHEAVAGGWPSRTQLWLHASDYRTGERVTFGRPGAPAADLSDAVVASAAVPAYYQPVVIGGRRYVDGALRSFTNADALAGEGCDVVVCLAPFSSRQRGSTLANALYGPLRGATSLGLAREARLLRQAGAHVVTLEPSAEDLRAMGINPMDRKPSRRVFESARASVARQLASGGLGADLGFRLRGPAERPALRAAA